MAEAGVGSNAGRAIADWSSRCGQAVSVIPNERLSDAWDARLPRENREGGWVGGSGNGTLRLVERRATTAQCGAIFATVFSASANRHADGELQ